MALIDCQDCGKQVSTAAKSCPNCGAKPRVPLRKQRMWPAKVFLVAVFGWVVFQVAGGGRPSAQSAPAQNVRCYEQRCSGSQAVIAIDNAKRSVRAILKDPDSARFEAVQYVPQPEGLAAVCGLFNGRNSFGGYGELQRFVSFGSPSLTYTEEGSSGFSERWSKVCGA